MEGRDGKKGERRVKRVRKEGRKERKEGRRRFENLKSSWAWPKERSRGQGLRRRQLSRFKSTLPAGQDSNGKIGRWRSHRSHLRRAGGSHTGETLPFFFLPHLPFLSSFPSAPSLPAIPSFLHYLPSFLPIFPRLPSILSFLPSFHPSHFNPTSHW